MQEIRNVFLRVLGDMPSLVGVKYAQHSNCELASNHVGDMNIPLNTGVPSRNLVKKKNLL